MKTGFCNAFCDKPGRKHYDYHGEKRDCLIQPGPGPFDEIDTDVDPPQWERFYDRSPSQFSNYGITYAMGDYRESSEQDNCYPSIKKRWYYCIIDLYRAPHPWDPTYYRWNDGNTCTVRRSPNVAVYQHFEWFCPTIHGRYYLMELFRGKPPTRIQIFRSTTGELPSGSP